MKLSILGMLASGRDKDKGVWCLDEEQSLGDEL